MRDALSEYATRVIQTWWARLSVGAGVVGLISELTNLVVPSWMWWLVVGVSAVFAQFTVFRHVRLQRDELTAQLAATQAPVEQPVFVPNLLDGRIFPTSDYPVIESGERGFVVRGALAFTLGSEHETLDSAGRQAFEDAVAASAIEGWFQEQVGVWRAVPHEQWWERVQPTRSQIVTVARAPARVPHYDFTLAGHCVLNLKPGLQPWHPGYGLLISSAILRPLDESEGAFGGLPLSFDDLYRLLTIFEVALVDEIAAAVLPRIETNEWQPRAYAALAIANGGSVAEYVGLNHHHWPRASGSDDQNALYGCASNEQTLREPNARDAEIKSWLTRFLTDSGFSDFEVDVRRLSLPTVLRPLPN